VDWKVFPNLFPGLRPSIFSVAFPFLFCAFHSSISLPFLVVEALNGFVNGVS